jgi:cell division protein FtsB
MEQKTNVNRVMKMKCMKSILIVALLCINVT